MIAARRRLRALVHPATQGIRAAMVRHRVIKGLAVLLATLGPPISASQAEPEIMVGAKGQAAYPDFERISSITSPEISAAGFLVLFSVTRDICLSVEAGDNDLAALAPKGFSIARGDLHSFGFEGKQKRAWWAISVTGDGEKDDAGLHPYWYVDYGKDGRPTECSMTWAINATGIDEATRQHVVHWLYIGAPQLFKSILVQPRFAGLHSPVKPDLIQLMRPCPGNWCQVTINPSLFKDNWRVSVTFQLKGATQ
ncbi:MAG: hypothetical protein ABJL55_08870 [Roseibium sp.]